MNALRRTGDRRALVILAPDRLSFALTDPDRGAGPGPLAGAGGGPGHERAPFLYAISLILLAYIGLGVSLWPYAVPREMTIWQATADPMTQGFLLIGVTVMIPLILAYTAYT